MGDAPFSCNIHSLFFDDATYIFFRAFCSSPSRQHTTRTSVMLRAAAAAAVANAYAMLCGVRKRFEMFRNASRCFESVSQCSSMFYYADRMLAESNVWAGIAHYPNTTTNSTHSFTEKFYNKWHFLGSWKRDGW